MRLFTRPAGVSGLQFAVVLLALLLASCKGAGSPDGTGSGSGGSGGSSSSGGSTGSGGSNSGAGGSSSGSATFDITITQSTAVATVEIVTWSVNASIDSAVINFGRDQSNFEFQAPVDLTQSNYRTLLLGMKQSTEYYVQVVAKKGSTTYSSDVKNVTTGYLPNGLPTFTVTDSNASALYASGGFTVNCFGLAGSPGIPGSTGKTTGFVFDKDGALVWALDLTGTPASNCSRARMSYDGQYLYAGNFANSATNGVVYRVGMDGTSGVQTWNLPGLATTSRCSPTATSSTSPWTT
jgi:hypothetical protein